MAEQRQGGGGARKSHDVPRVREEVERRRGPTQSAIAAVGRTLSRPLFVVGLLVAHVLWMVLNIRGLVLDQPWDPYPYTFLATLASIEGPLIALMILLRQHRDAQIAELREEVQLQISLRLERRGAVQLTVLHALAERLSIPASEVMGEEPEESKLEEPLDPKTLIERVRERLERVEGEEER